MKLRYLIFLTLLCLGIVPILALVAINLTGHIERHEKAAGEQTRIRSEIDLKLLNTNTKRLQDIFFQATSLAGSIYQPDELTAPIERSKLEELMGLWYGSDEEVTEYELIDLAGNSRFRLRRADSISFQPVLGTAENFSGKAWFQSGLELGLNQISVQLITRKDICAERSCAWLITPIFTPLKKKVGLALLTINLTLFLKDYADSFWITNDGTFLYTPDDNFILRQIGNRKYRKANFPENVFSVYPGLRDKLGDAKPVILMEDSIQTMTWIPLSFSESSLPSFWLGKPVDRAGVVQWKKSLIINITGIVLAVMLVVLFIAHTLAKKADNIKDDILTGLETILNREQEVPFQWSGPKELQTLASELTLLSRRYALASQARRTAEAALIESEDRFRNLTATAQDAITMMDSNGDITYWNEAAKEIFGYESEEALGKPIHALISPRLSPEQDEIRSIHNKPAASGPIRETLELLTTRKDGTEVPIELSLSEARIKDQWNSMWIIRDISERKQAEEKARLQQQQLIQADKMISLGLLISGVAHEINNPNSIAMLNSTMLAKTWESLKPILEEYYVENGDFLVAGIDYSEMREQIPRLLIELDDSTKRIKNIVQDLKDYARQETTQHVTSVNINDVVEAAIRLTYNQIKKAANQFTTDLGADLPPIKGSKQRLEQVVINLIQNSCDALRNGQGSIIITTSYDDNKQTVDVEVKDTGVGIARKDLNKITDPFYTTKRSVGGTGLGLSVSAGIVKEHHGLLQFSSVKGRGTVARVLFPVETTD